MEFYARSMVEKGHVYRMEHAGFKAALMRAPKLKDYGSAHGLPPGDQIPVYPLAALPGAPDGWVREAGSYVCPVDSEWGLWFDWTMNDQLNTAVVPSCKGMNPITGQKLEGLGLEEYSDKCPVHKEPFAHGNFCEKCGYEWPPQNYVCSPNTLWWDGFRQPDGKVRQFFFSEDESRDIASLVIGKENTVPAFGFGFFRPVSPRMAPKIQSRGVPYADSCVNHHIYYSASHIAMGDCGPSGMAGENGPSGSMGFMEDMVETMSYAPTKSVQRATKSAPRMMACGSSKHKSVTREDSANFTRAVKSVSVGAGAEIRQSLQRDNLGLAGWQPEPAGTIRLYFCFKEQFQNIINNGGVKVFENENSGFMKGLPVG